MQSDSIPAMAIERTEPGFDHDEVGMLRAFIDRHRATVRMQAIGLTDEQLCQTLGPSDLTLGGMLKHLAFVEDYWFSYVLHDDEPAEPWRGVDWESDPDWDWYSAAGSPYAELDALLADAIARSDALLNRALAGGGLDQRMRRTRRNGETATLRWLLVHMLEEYARHAGHADLIRQSIDGATDV